MTTVEAPLQFWDRKHDEHDYGALSDTSLESYCHTLDIVAPRQKEVLEIGWGTGRAAQEMMSLDNRVSVLDVSSKACEIAKHCGAFEVYRTPVMLPTSWFNLVTCHLVAQHMTDTQFELQIKHVIRSLSRDGIAAYQMAGSLDRFKDNSRYDTWDDPNVSCCYYRSPEKTTRQIEEAGGKLTWIGNRIDYPQYHSYWFTVHFGRRSE
jgi:hypothetical protein